MAPNPPTFGTAGPFTAVADCPGCKATIVVLAWPRDPGACWVCRAALKWSYVEGTVRLVGL